MTDKQILEKVDEAMKLGRKQALEQIKNRLEKMPFYFGTTFHGETIKTVDVDKVIEMLDEAIKEVEHGALFDETNGR